MGRTSGFLLGRVLAIAGVGLLAGLITVAWFGRGGCGPSRIFIDTSRLRQVVGFCIDAREFPAKDGAFDPYELVRRGTITREHYDLFRSEHLGIGPTDDEIERGDYTSFPWERCRGETPLWLPAYPILWEKTPDRHGGRIVAFSDGCAAYYDGPDFAIACIVSVVARLRRLPMRDGAFDPYAFVREGLLPADLLRPGPTDDEIARGDYANFRWERYRGDGRLDGAAFPLLWATRPDEWGDMPVGRSDGTVGSR